MGVGSIFSKR